MKKMVAKRMNNEKTEKTDILRFSQRINKGVPSKKFTEWKSF